MKSEFESLVGKEVSQEDYTTIEFVYLYHPSISGFNGKEEIANIYKLPRGMRIIRDMLITANRQENLENTRNNRRSRLKELKIELEDITAEIEELEQKMADLRR